MIIKFGKEQKRMILLTLIVSFFSSLLVILLPIYIAQSFDLLFAIKSHRAKILRFLPSVILHSFTYYFAFFLLLLFLRGLLDYFQRYLIGVLGENYLKYVRKLIFKHQLEINMHVYDEKGIGKYLLRYSGDLAGIQNLFTKGIIRFFSDFILLLLSLYLLFYINKSIGIVFLLLGIILGVFVYFMNKKLYYASLNRRNAKSGLLSFVNQRLGAMLTIKSFNRRSPELKRFEKKTEKLKFLGKKYQAITSAIGALIPFGLYLIIGVIMLVVYGVQQNPEVLSIHPDEFFIIILLLITLLPVFRRVFRVSIIWRNGSISYQKLMDILRLPNDANKDKSNFVFEKGTISVRNISFAYKEEAMLFQNFSFSALSYNTTFIHGEMGAGKTTLLKLLNNIYFPQTGEILFDGQATTAVNTRSLRRSMAVIGEDWHLLGKNVFEVISYSKKTEKRTKASQYLKQIDCTKQLSLEMPIGELGSNLSKGQKKILQYTRALLTKKPILLIDEPFEGVDDETKQHLIHILNSYHKQKTILLFSNYPPSEGLEVDKVVGITNG